MGTYLATNPANPVTEGKQVHDPIAQTIRLEPWEVFILDSPLVQRLRYVRQLGVGHFLFPTCGYSRFEHSIGALSAASELFDAVVAQSPLLRGISADGLRERRRIIRLAALLHDVGHCVFSHVSEKFYGQDGDVVKAVFGLNKFYEVKLAPAEATAILIIQSEAFATLLSRARLACQEYKDTDIIDLVSACIAGSKLRAQPDVFLCEIINGPVDCDKLDYLVRDAHMAGVPVSLDVDRLLSKLRIAEMSPGGTKLYALAVVPGGARALEELLLSRIFLFDKFYYHPKIMAAEELIRLGLARLADAIPSLSNPAGLLVFGDDELLAAGPRDLAHKYRIAEDSPELQAACDAFRRARLRDLPKRAFAFAGRFMPGTPEAFARFENAREPEAGPRSVTEFMLLNRRLEQRAMLEKYCAMIAEYAAELSIDTHVSIGLQPPKRAAGAMDLPVVMPGGEIESKPDFLFKVGEWSEAYRINKETSYVFADDGLARVHLAAERTFAGYPLTFAPKCWVYAKLSQTEIDAARAQLPKTEQWRPHRLPPNYLSSQVARQRLSDLVKKFASYHFAYFGEIGEKLVESWVWQFPDADLQDSALGFLEHLTFVQPVDVVAAIKRRLLADPTLNEALWIPIRPRAGPGTSADVVQHDLKESGLAVCPVGELTVDELRRRRRVVFFDDYLNSGPRSRALSAAGFSVPGRHVKVPLSVTR